jgi:GT2 family glycosyltransferase
MLIATLNHNLPLWTDNLVRQLQKDPEFSKSELMVVDNGSKLSMSKYTTHSLDRNVFFGGGFNVVLEYFLSSDHDYLYFLNNDLVFHGPSFISTSLKQIYDANASVYSPSIINASIDQCHWKQMWNWGKGIREVKWIDFQAPLLRRDILERIVRFPDQLVYGWGLDFYTGCIAETDGFKTVVSDTNTICHMNSLTFKENKIDIGVDEFCRQAEHNMRAHFFNSEYKDLYQQLRTYGETYSI